MQTIRQRLHALLLLAALTISLAVPASAAGSLPFTDVEKGHWACDEIREAAVSHIYRKSGEGETWLTYER